MKTLKMAVALIALNIYISVAYADDIEWEGVSYEVNKYGTSIVVRGRVVNNTSRDVTLSIAYGCDDADGNIIDMYEFPLNVPANSKQPFERRQVDNSDRIKGCWIKGSEFR